MMAGDREQRGKRCNGATLDATTTSGRPRRDKTAPISARARFMQTAADMQARTLFDQATPNGRGFCDVTPAAVAALRDGHIVDVRQPAEFNDALGHIPGAVLVPLATLAGAARAWDPAAPLVVVCRSGGRSSNAAAQLAAAGFTRVMNMAGGMLAYRAEGLPVEP